MRGLCGLLSAFLFCSACSPQKESLSTNAFPTQTLRTCEKIELLGHVPSPDETVRHRRFAMPVITRPFGSERESWKFDLKIKVDAQGRPICYLNADEFGRKQVLDQERNAVIIAVATWRYMPFVVDGAPAVAIVTESISEQEAPERRLPLPEVPLDQVRIRLERTGCYGMCPAYCVDIHGDGRVVYKGNRHVDVLGTHSYRIPVASVAGLVRSLKEKDLWSLRPSYSASITDNPTYFLDIEMGGQKHRIEDYVGEMAGMPAAVTEFENEVDLAAQTDAWINLGMPAVDRLVAEGFRFDSEPGTQLLARAIANENAHDNAAILRVMSLRVPELVSAKAPGVFGMEGQSLLDEALANRRSQVVERLIEEGALQTRGRIDSGKLDAAFRAAIESGALQSVEAIWKAGGINVRPSLTFDDDSGEGQGKRQRSPVILLLSHRHRKDAWEGNAIARWLVAKGNSLKARRANGETLLHIAAEAGDAEFVRYLLDNGLSPSTPGEFGLPPLGGVSDEKVALMLLEAGTDMSMMDGDESGFRRYAMDNHWQHVIAWLDSRDAKKGRHE